MSSDDLKPRFAGTFHVTDDIRYVERARFLAGEADGRLILIDTEGG